MTYKRFKKGQKFKIYELTKRLGSGGNGEVWLATLTNDSSKTVAIKLLTRIYKDGYQRFKDEVKVLAENKDIKGLLPIVDYYLPNDPKVESPWYTMSIAMPLMKYIRGKLPSQIVDIMISVSNIIIKLHRRGISHRDIKPDNILVLNDELYLSDFGLVHYASKEDITVEDKALGPRWTIAPEMKRDPQNADGTLADVYSLAKTLWILLTNEKKGFEGQYNTDTNIDLKKFVPSIYHGTLNTLLHNCTDNDPNKRPNVKEFKSELIKWKKLNNDFEMRTKAEWEDIQEKLFPAAMPKRVMWENINDIIKVLNIICEYDHANHTLLPNRGGLDLTGAKLSFEDRCIELDFGAEPFIVKPKLLILETFEEYTDWAYLRLETEGLELIDNINYSREDEAFTELEPCVYTNYECYDYNDYNGKQLPPNARQVIRVKRGSFIICLKTGVYNSIPNTYDGRHNNMNADDFREYITRMIIKIESDKRNTKAKINNRIKKPIFKKSIKIRKGSRILDSSEIVLIKKIITLFKKQSMEEDKLIKNAGLEKNGGIISTDLNSIKTMSKIQSAPRSMRDKFRIYLDSLSDDKLKLIEAVMYGGRDASISGRAHPLDEMLESLRSDTRKSRIYAITTKASLEIDLTEGIKFYK